MSMASALGSVGGNLMFRRQRDRLQSERVAVVEDEESGLDVSSGDEQEGSFMNQSESDAPSVPDIEEGVATDNEEEEEEEETEESETDADTEGVTRFRLRHTMTLAELEEEREIARRRSSACILFALFVLFRLWVVALQDGDFGVLLLCLVGSSWTARWIRHNREQEEELDRRIANYLENNENGSNEVGREDLRMLSFQAQLALAIMESQRQMMQGGHGHPDGEDEKTGVSDAAKAKWTNFTFTESLDNKQGKYGSVEEETDLKAGLHEEEPHCSICLGEYEDKEVLTQLPCKHIYHDECISSWCSSHTRCPLCNLDLETEGDGAV